MDRTRQVECVVTRCGRHDRRVVLAHRSLALRQVEGRLEGQLARLLVTSRDHHLEIVGGEVGDRVVIGVVDDHLHAVCLADVGRLVLPADFKRVWSCLLDDVGHRDARQEKAQQGRKYQGEGAARAKIAHRSSG